VGLNLCLKGCKRISDSWKNEASSALNCVSSYADPTMPAGAGVHRSGQKSFTKRDGIATYLALASEHLDELRVAGKF
jgi:hypothetical protein